MVKITVLVPVYNVEKYIRECLDSILNQSFTDLEIICVDDGSTDGSGRILDGYAQKDDRLRVIHKINTGYGAAMNTGLAAAQGEYIGIVESDDFIESNMYMDLYRIAKLHDLDFVKANHWTYSSAGRKLADGTLDCECEKIFFKYENMSKLLTSKSIWAGIYRREFLVQYKIRFLETPGASYQDTSFWFKVGISAERGYFTKNAYVNYRVDNEGSSVKSKEKVFCICDEMEECKRFLFASNLDIKKIYPYFVLNKKNVYRWNAERIAPEFCCDFIKSAGFELRQDICSPYMDMSVCSKEAINDIKIFTDYAESYYRYLIDKHKMISTENLEEYVSLLKNERRIYIYGAGKVGHRWEMYMRSKGTKCAIDYVVTDKTEEVTEDILEIANRQLLVNRPIIIAIRNKDMRRWMVIRALDRGFEKVYALGDEVINDIFDDKKMICS